MTRFDPTQAERCQCLISNTLEQWKQIERLTTRAEADHYIRETFPEDMDDFAICSRLDPVRLSDYFERLINVYNVICEAREHFEAKKG
jgi:hypothetical protein